MEFIDAISKVFKIDKVEVASIENFVTKEFYTYNDENLLIVDNKEQ